MMYPLCLASHGHTAGSSPSQEAAEAAKNRLSTAPVAALDLPGLPAVVQTDSEKEEEVLVPPHWCGGMAEAEPPGGGPPAPEAAEADFQFDPTKVRPVLRRPPPPPPPHRARRVAAGLELCSA